MAQKTVVATREIVRPRQYASRANHSQTNEARLKRITREFRSGYKLLETIHRGVTIFGSTRTQPGEKLYVTAERLGGELAERGFTVVTGGGPGIMEAATKGARARGGRTVAFAIDLPQEQKNRFVKEVVTFYYFYVRKVMLASSSHAYVYFPGGFGTLDEFFEISTLIATHKLHEDVPVVLVGKKYWEPLMRWLRHTVVEGYHAFDPYEFDMWRIVDSAEEAVKVVEQCSGRMGVCKY